METLFNFSSATVSTLFIILIVWSLVWKGLALWKSARLNQKYWFVALLIVNTVGILEIVYIFVVARKKEKETTQMGNSGMPTV
ncbi:MAG TPA: DUF5652 family protein [Candidatus Paceibacterota bacterium]